MTTYGFLVWTAANIASLLFQGTRGEFGIVGSNHFYVSPLEEFTVSGYFKYCYNSTYCPTCVRQVYVNIFNTSHCVVRSIRPRNIDCKRHYFSAKFVTPATPENSYNISIFETLLYKCAVNPKVPRKALIYGTVRIKEVTPPSCRVKTVSGKCCHFPFTYKGKVYRSCTTVDHAGKLWCSLTAKYAGKWGNCKGYYKYCYNSTYCPTCVRQVYVNIFNTSHCVVGNITRQNIDCKQHYFSAKFVTPATPENSYNISIFETLLHKCAVNPKVPRKTLIYGTVRIKEVNTTEPPGYSCDQPLNVTLHEVKRLFNDSQAALKASNSLELMANITTKTVESAHAGMGKLNTITTVNILEHFVRLNERHSNTVISSARDQQNFLNIASSLLSPSNNKVWQQNPEINSSSIKLIKTLDKYGFQVAKQLPSSGDHSTSYVYSQNIAMKVDKISRNSQVKSKGLYFERGNSSIYLPPEVLNSSSTVMVVSFIFKNLDQALNHSISVAGYSFQSHIKVGTTIVSSSVRPYPSSNLSSPVVLRLSNRKPYYGYHQPTCVFYRPASAVTKWLPTGCSLVPEASDSNVTTCQCSHLTVFAALMDPYQTPGRNIKAHKRPLEIISIVGCSFSLCGTLLTIIILAVFWNKLKSPRTVILLNLCIAIATWSILIILEGFVRSNKSGCTVVAVLLHYFLLASFLWMLCQGVLLYSMLVTVVGSGAEEKLKYFFGVGWGVPALVVSISFWSTGGVGYGSNGTCWLSKRNGLIWAFIGPVLFIITCNIIIFILVLRNLIRCRYVQLKSRIEKIKSSAKATAAILPLLGLTWIFGILSFNSDTLVFKYAFSLFNSLQGLMIFVFHCLLNTQVRDAMRPRRNVKVVISKTNGNNTIQNQALTLELSSNHLRTAWTPNTMGNTSSPESSRRSSQSSRGSNTALELQITLI